MNPIQYDLLTNTIQPEPQLANAKLLYAQDPRTLIYGYTGEKSTFHVYLNGGVIHKVVYDFSGKLLSHKSQSEGLLFSECVPDKRIYPETCDFEFCSLLKRRGVNLSFYNWNDERERAAFYGKRLEELQQPAPASVDLDIPVDAAGWNLNPDPAPGGVGHGGRNLGAKAQGPASRSSCGEPGHGRGGIPHP